MNQNLWICSEQSDFGESSASVTPKKIQAQPLSACYKYKIERELEIDRYIKVARLRLINKGEREKRVVKKIFDRGIWLSAFGENGATAQPFT